MLEKEPSCIITIKKSGTRSACLFESTANAEISFHCLPVHLDFDMRKSVFGGLQTTKVKTRLRIHAV